MQNQTWEPTKTKQQDQQVERTPKFIQVQDRFTMIYPLFLFFLRG